jgi:hypothetical protein
MFLFRFILFILVFYLLIQFIGRVLFAFGRRASGSSDTSRSSEQRRKEGKVYVDSRGDKKQKIIRKDEGEYIKYEEIKDE